MSANIKVAVTFTCGMEMEFGLLRGEVTCRLPHKRFSIEPAKAVLISRVLRALAEYPSSKAFPTTDEMERALSTLKVTALEAFES